MDCNRSVGEWCSFLRRAFLVEALLKEMGYVYGNRESTFGEGRLSLFFAAMHLKEAADGRSCR